MKIDKIKRKNLKWKYNRGSYIQTPLSIAGEYIISHRPDKFIFISGPDRFILSYRPLGRHHDCGEFPTLAEAKQAAQKHHDFIQKKY
ncbi:MAG: hypothetical protein AABY22_19945 [Nanoarchaeota archaeon]